MKDFLSNISLDFVKLGITLYLLGLFTSALHFSRYSILALDFTKPQSILVGGYILFFYEALPALFLAVLAKFHRTTVQMFAFCTVLLVKDTALLYLLGYRSWNLVGIIVLSLLLELLFFLEFGFSVNGKPRRTRLNVVPTRIRILAFTVIFSVYFATFVFPLIPSSLGGAKPLRVHVFTETADLSGSRFVMSKNQPKINSKLDSFALFLVYETSNDMYFLEERVSNSGLEGYSVMRIKRDEILRIDYVTPKWVTLREGLQ
jgi:hypothetical protein